jgi:hypothetical protein
MHGLAERLSRSHELCRTAERLQGVSRALIAHIRHQQRHDPIRRLYHLARGGACDEMLIALDFRCPRCAGDAITPTGYVLAVGGRVYTREQCTMCDRPFLVARRPMGTPPAAGRRQPPEIASPAEGDSAPEAGHRP